MSSTYINQGYNYGPFWDPTTGTYNFNGSNTNTAGPGAPMGPTGMEGPGVSQPPQGTSGLDWGGIWNGIKGVGGWAVDNIGGLLNTLGGGSAGKGVQNIGSALLIAQMLKQSSDDRKAWQEFQQQLFDTAQGGLGKAEDLFDSKAPLREKGMEALLAAMDRTSQSGMASSSMTRLNSGQRKAGEYV